MKNFFHGLKQKVENFDSQHQQHQQQQPFSAPFHQPSIPNSESSALAERTFQYFYSAKNNQFQGKVKSESTLGAENDFGYVVWPVSIMLHATADCLPPQRIHQAVSAHQQYWNPEQHAFCAWKMFPGNDDIYYDDNAHAVQAFISSFQATGESRYLDQATDILFNFIIPSGQRDGGIPWHISNDKARAACSTGPAAISALRISAIRYNGNLVAFAERALCWLKQNLQDPGDKLIWDQLSYKEDGSTDINRMKWTYNSGFAIHAFTLLYEATRKDEYLNTAIEIAEAAMNPEAPLFDHCIPNPSQRMLSDGSFFLHHLVDGYVALSKHTHTEQLRNEIRRIADWGREFMLDPADGLYYRGSSPYTISEENVRKFNAKFGLNKGLEVNGQERDEQGNLCKTMLGCASWARILHAAETT
ncbi:glycoside hydrolase family 76 protein [Sclerotinia borealis F-4128]|uniref:Glycoside hydrolase family 76 protein n=1 Tax=Sclerotinia borealis (strain F-4128) TaxID=1432307 RepID=W9C7Y3_SCLBF|nr:glycoside hydrolase family 76 protein [Sclerotinia borealis F-4128]